MSEERRSSREQVMAVIVKVEVKPSALIRRANRQLEKEGSQVRRGKKVMGGALGDFFLVEGSRVTQPNLDLRELAKERGLLEPFEVLAR
jgi:hypothetical protein